MKNEMNIHEIVSELDRISSLYNHYQSLSGEMDHLAEEKEAEDKDFAEEIVATLHSFRESQDKMFSAKRPHISSACLATPPEPPQKPKTSNPVKDIFVGALSGLIMMFSIALWILMVILDTSASGLIYFSVLMLFGSLGFWAVKGAAKATMFIDWQTKQKEWQEKHLKWEADFNRSATKEENERFLNEFREYDTCFLNLVEVCSQKYADELKHYEAGLEAIKEKHLQKLEQVRDELLKVAQLLDNATLIHSDLYSNAWRISAMLKTGRADSLKEAINLALDEERKDMEEAARRAEARQQEAILEQQARDNRIHNAAMQRAAEEEARATRAHNAAMERAAQAQAQAAQAQAREAARQSEFAQKQARDAQRAASARCANCANSTKCTYKVKQNAGSCGAYRPR